MTEARWAALRPPAGLRHKRKTPFRPTIIAPADLRPRLQEISQLDRQLDRFVLRAKDYLELVADAWAANFHATTAIEGNPLTLEEVRRTTRKRIRGDTDIPTDPHHQEIVQHILSWAADDLFRGPWNADRVRRIHHILTADLGADYQPGRFRDDPQRIQVAGPEGTIWFEGAPGTHVAEEMEELLRWLREEAPALHPLVAGTLFFHEFESIHPFEDGNGRVGRVLFHGYIQNNGLNNAHKCLVEPALTDDPDLYYRILAHTDATGSYTEILDFFTERTLQSYQDAVQRFQSRDLLTTGVDENKKRLLIQAKRHGDWFTIAQAREWIDGRSEATVSQYLRFWEDEEAIESTGSTKDRRFRFRDPLRGIVEEAKRQLQTG